MDITSEHMTIEDAFPPAQNIVESGRRPESRQGLSLPRFSQIVAEIYPPKFA
jgi:hypothetical protein